MLFQFERDLFRTDLRLRDAVLREDHGLRQTPLAADLHLYRFIRIERTDPVTVAVIIKAAGINRRLIFFRSITHCNTEKLNFFSTHKYFIINLFSHFISLFKRHPIQWSDSSVPCRSRKRSASPPPLSGRRRWMYSPHRAAPHRKLPVRQYAE